MWASFPLCRVGGLGGAGSAFPLGTCPSPWSGFLQYPSYWSVSGSLPRGWRGLTETTGRGFALFNPELKVPASLSRTVENSKQGDCWCKRRKREARGTMRRRSREDQVPPQPCLQNLQGFLLLPSLFLPPFGYHFEQGTQSQLPSMPSPQEDLTTPRSAASPTLPTPSGGNGSQIIMRPAASAPSLELCRWHPHTTLGRGSQQGLRPGEQGERGMGTPQGASGVC